MPRSRGIRRASRKAKQWVWTAARIDLDLNTAATPLGVDLAAGADWRSTTTGYETATLTSIRGWLMASPLDGTATQHISFALITKKSNETAFSAADPNDVTTYVNEDILWTAGYSAPNQSEATGIYYSIDVKTKRKLSVNDDIRLIFSEAAAISPQATNWRGLVRCLIQTLS